MTDRDSSPGEGHVPDAGENHAARGSEQWTRKEVARLSQVRELWNDPKYVPLRFMTKKQWAQVERFVESLERNHEKPVLYAMKRGDVHLSGGLLGLGKYRTVDILFVVYPGAVYRYAWRRYLPYNADNVLMSNGDLRVGDVGGVPYDPVLYLADSEEALPQPFGRTGSIRPRATAAPRTPSTRSTWERPVAECGAPSLLPIARCGHCRLRPTRRRGSSSPRSNARSRNHVLCVTPAKPNFSPPTGSGGWGLGMSKPRPWASMLESTWSGPRWWLR